MGETLYYITDSLILSGAGFWLLVNPSAILTKLFKDEKKVQKWITVARIAGVICILNGIVEATHFL